MLPHEMPRPESHRRHTPAQPVPVTVISPKPVPVADVTSRLAVSAERVSLDPGGQPLEHGLVAVPAGFRLVIEYVSGSARIARQMVDALRTVASTRLPST